MTTPAGKNRIMIFGPKSDGTYVIEFRTAAGESLTISIPGTEAAVFKSGCHTDCSCRMWIRVWNKPTCRLGSGLL
jgi:hypothetical protein